MNMLEGLCFPIVMIMFLFYNCVCVMTVWEIDSGQENTMREQVPASPTLKHIFITNSILTD